MTGTGHALVGTLIAGRFTDPYTSIGLSFISHFACDILPHWDSGTNKRKKTKERLFTEAVIDVIISIIASYFVYTAILRQDNLVHLGLNVFAAQFPDWMSVPYFILKIRLPFSVQMDKIQTRLHNKLDKPWGIITQIIIVVALYILFFKIVY